MLALSNIGSISSSVATSQPSVRASSLRLAGGENVSDEDTGSGPESVIFEYELTERDMFGEKVDQGDLGI